MTVDVAAPALISTITTVESVNKQKKTQQNEQKQRIIKRLLPHDLISSDFDELKFNAAASIQLQWQGKEQKFHSSTPTDSHLIASPYNNTPHLLDLETLDTQSRLFALALSFFKPVRDDYATAEYLDSFNWAEVLDLLKNFAAAEGHTWTTQSFYVVAFRSRLQPGVDQDHLHALDAYSHQEAVASGGLLKYWFGTKNGERQNLATCVWRGREDAQLGGRGPWHAKARAAARELYESIVFTTMELVIEDNVDSWMLRDWQEGHASQ
ncbi:hypothetical protein N7462_000533 [Penicillium macrosclerotiorum]|uniref:uncharacterized protein n=1 Tax=Penicillium macrosclerotiorum TaxID=303699 RepID=UPI002549C0BD|nr:uncharacterized protein N7462_000533 [Penicillium macrosclerotiorum]KAJ5698528.1 hypothetical protein N7462_000533 [Penicillium macrosclerotiorum]